MSLLLCGTDLIFARLAESMGCAISALRGVVGGGGQIAGVKRLLGEGGFSFVYLVREVLRDAPDEAYTREYALKRVLIQTDEQLAAVRRERDVMRRFNHPNLLDLIDADIAPAPGCVITVVVPDLWLCCQAVASSAYVACLLFPVYRKGTLQDTLLALQKDGKWLPPPIAMQIILEASMLVLFSVVRCCPKYRQVAEGLSAMHNDPNEPYAHNDVKPHNVLLADDVDSADRGKASVSNSNPSQRPIAVLMDFGSAGPARRRIKSRMEALALQEWAESNASAPYRAPELWDCPSDCLVDERTDVWALGCTLYATMCGGMSPFEYSLGEAGGSLALAAIGGRVKWPPAVQKRYPQMMLDLVPWILDVHFSSRSNITDAIGRMRSVLAHLDDDARYEGGTNASTTNGWDKAK
eukprot:jgi/Chlat1/5063/Chrsp33S05069